MKDRRKLKEYYDSLAKTYDELYGKEQKKKHEIVLRVLPKRKGTFLDLGCGTGELSLKASKLGWFVVAADISTGMLNHAKKKGVRPLVQCSFDDPPFRDHAFDFIAAITVFSDHKELKGRIDVLKDLVKRDGIIVASVPLKGAEKQGLAKFEGVNDAFLFLGL